MSSVATTKLDALLVRTGRTKADFAKGTRLGKVFRRHGVPTSPELARIVALPHYVWQQDPELAVLAEQLTEYLALPPRVDCDDTCVCRGKGRMELRLLQAAAFQAIHDYRGMLGPIRVGGGKTLLTYLAAVVLGAERPLLFEPAKLRHKTEREFAQLARHWRGKAPLIMSYELLARDRGVKELEEYGPDLIMADEAHRFKNLHAARTRRIHRYLDAHDVPYVDLSGTITKRSVLEYHHRAIWALGEGRSPLPLHRNEAADWALAIDEKVKPEARMMPGALAELCNDEELAQIAQASTTKDDVLQAARSAYRRRLVSIPGVVATEDKDDSGVALVIESRKLALPDSIRDAFDRLRTLWETPDGHPFSEAVEKWRHARELACGFYYRWDPRPPEDWLEARRNWERFVRSKLGHSRKIDTKLQVANACAAGIFPDTEYRAWEAIRTTFKPNKVPVWISSDALVADVQNWLAEGSGLIWVEHVAVGERLEELLGIPYFGRQGLDRQKRFIEDWRGLPAIVSIQANMEGRNLQYHWHRNYITSATPLGADWEQMLGRTHRDGQEADEVEVAVALSCLEQWEGFEQARRDAEYIGRTTGQEQKLQVADIDVPTLTEVLSWWADPLWRQT